MSANLLQSNGQACKKVAKMGYTSLFNDGNEIVAWHCMKGSEVKTR